MSDIHTLLDEVFRQSSGQVIAVLTRVFGIENLALAEDVMQDTLVKALQQWPATGVPSNPTGWILQVAKHGALDVLRRETIFRGKQQQIAAELESRMEAALQRHNRAATSEFEDEQLALMFTCCHPAFTRDAQTALILKTLCGFNTTEIARAYLTQESAIAQRIVRSKRKIREQKIRFELPGEPELAERLETVLEVIYLIFNEGYGASDGDFLIRQDLCEEALRLASMLIRSRPGDSPAAHALFSLLLFQASRLKARTDADGNLLLLAEQDRSRWDRQMIDLGLRHLDLSATGDHISEYHPQAAIASAHAVATSHESTNWRFILDQYDQLLELNPSPIWKLNRAVALAEVAGVEAALEELERLAGFTTLQSYHLYHATRAEMLQRAGRTSEAVESYGRAIDLATTKPELRFLQRKVAALCP